MPMLKLTLKMGASWPVGSPKSASTIWWKVVASCGE